MSTILYNPIKTEKTEYKNQDILLNKSYTNSPKIQIYDLTSIPFSNITAVVLAGGMETRLTPMRLYMPKAFIPLIDKPLIDHQVNRLLQEVSQVVIAGGWLSNIFDLEYSRNRAVSITGDPTIGTGVALIEAASNLNVDHIVSCNADTINEVSLDLVFKEHLDRGIEDAATIVLTRRSEVQNAGAFAVASDGRVIRSFEDKKPGKPPHPDAAWHGASTGIIIIPRKLLLEVSRGLVLSLERDILPRIISLRKLFAFDNKDGYSLDIGTPERFGIFAENQKRLVEIIKK